MTRPVDRIPNREPQPSMSFPEGMTGTERMKRLVRVERIRQDMHGVTLEATQDVRKHLPAEYHHRAYDLRRGRLWAFGGFTRFVDMLSHGQLSRVKARELALRLRELARQYVDLILTAPDVEAVEVRHEKVRVYRPMAPVQGLRVVRSERGPGEGTSGRGVA